MKTKKRIKDLQSAISFILLKTHIQKINDMSELKNPRECFDAEKILSLYLEVLNYILDDDNTDFDFMIEKALGR